MSTISTSEAIEERLKRLVDANEEPNRKRWALDWKQRGGRVIGLIGPDVPEEIIYAARMLPIRISGTWQPDTPKALMYWPERSCPYCRHVLESLLSGELDMLDGIMATSSWQDIVRLYDLCALLRKPPFAHIIYLPHRDSELMRHYFANGIWHAIRTLQGFFGVEVTSGSLRSAIELCNRTRQLLSQLSQLRKRDIPPVSGAEMLGITTAAATMPKGKFSQELEELLPYLERRLAPLQKVKPRLLISGDLVDNKAYVELIEGAGSLVVMDDLDVGSRYFHGNIDVEQEDLVYSITKRYLCSRPTPPHMFDWDKQAEQVIQWVKEYKVDGVIELRQRYARPREMRAPFFKSLLDKANIPNIGLECEYHLANVEQIRTRVQAFVETLEM